MSIGPEHRQAVRTETVVSIAINSLVPAAIIWFLDVPPPLTLFGEHAILGSLLPAAGLATLLMTLVLTNIVRVRVRKGSLPALNWPKAERGALAWIPGNLILRAIALALLALVLLVPSGLVVVALIGVLPLTKVGFLIFNLIYGAIVGLVMARFVVLPALADPVR
jgi:hypothetical protein